MTVPDALVTCDLWIETFDAPDGNVPSASPARCVAPHSTRRRAAPWPLWRWPWPAGTTAAGGCWDPRSDDGGTWGAQEHQTWPGKSTKPGGPF